MYFVSFLHWCSIDLKIGFTPFERDKTPTIILLPKICVIWFVISFLGYCCHFVASVKWFSIWRLTWHCCHSLIWFVRKEFVFQILFICVFVISKDFSIRIFQQTPKETRCKDHKILIVLKLFLFFFFWFVCTNGYKQMEALKIMNITLRVANALVLSDVMTDNLTNTHSLKLSHSESVTQSAISCILGSLYYPAKVVLIILT